MDAATFDKARAGDEASIQIVVDKYIALAYSVAYKWVKRGVIEKDEAVGEALLALMKCIRGNFDSSKGDFAYYMATAVDNQIKMYLRSTTRICEFECRNPVSNVNGEFLELIDTVADGVDVEKEVEDRFLYAEIMDCMEILKAFEAVCLLCYCEGMTHREIAVLYGVSYSYVGQVCARAIEKLRKKLSSDDKEL